MANYSNFREADKKSTNKKMAPVMLYCSVIFFALGIISFCFMFFLPDGNYDRSQYGEVSGTVVSVQREEINGSITRSGTWWIIRLENHTDIYRIIPFSKDFIDIPELADSLPAGTLIYLRITEYKGVDSVYNIMEICESGRTLLGLDDMIGAQQKGDRDIRLAGIIMLAFNGTIALLLLVFGIRRQRKRIMGEHGELRIRVEYLGNLIEVYNATATLTFLINGAIAAVYHGLVSTKFTLKSEINTPEGKKEVILKLNIFGTLRLMCEGRLLAKKFIPFG